MLKVRHGAGLVLALSAMSVGGSAAAQGINAARAFGARDMVIGAALSPDGKRVALIQPLAEAQANALFVAEVGSDVAVKPVLQTTGRPDRLRSCGWVSNTRLVCEATFMVEQGGGDVYGFSRLVALNADGYKFQLLSPKVKSDAYSTGQYGGDVVDWLAGDSGSAVLMAREFAEDYATGTRTGNTKSGLAVERIDTETLKRTLVESPRYDATRYISDQHGVVRIYGRMAKDIDAIRGREEFVYRPDAKGRWQSLGFYEYQTQTGFWPVAVDPDLNAVYGFEKIAGRKALVRIALDGSLKREVVLARPDVDVDQLIRVGRQRRVVGASYATEQRHAVFFDPALKALATSLSKALPGQPVIRFVDASLDESRLLLWAGSDVDPGRYYLYDKATRSLQPLIDNRPALESVKLAQVKPVTYKAADGTAIPGYLTLPPSGAAKNLPAIVMPHGGPSSRDEWGFDWLSQFYANRGYAVLQPNFRGSEGYGDSWFQKNGFQSWNIAVGDINDAGRWLVAQGIAAPDKLAIVGWSYGGYAALQSQVVEPQLFKAVVAIAPVTDLDLLREEFRGSLSVDKFIGRGPHVKEGSPARNAERFAAPVLMFHGDLDQNVEVGESRVMLSRLKSAGKKADLVVFPGLDHQLDDSKAREDMLSRSDTFLRQTLGL